MTRTREEIGRAVRDAFVEVADELGVKHPETPAWEALPVDVKELYKRIGERVVRFAGGST